MKKFLSNQKNLLDSFITTADLTPPLKRKIPFGRLSVVTAIVGLGVAGVAIGIKSIGYRFTHLVLEGGLVNGKVVRLRSPIDGKVTGIDARSGMNVKNKEILAIVEGSPQEQHYLLEREAELRSKLNQLKSALQSHTLQKERLQNLEKKHQLLWKTEVAISTEAIAKSQATLAAAKAKSKTSQLIYQRYQKLQSEGAISKYKVDELYSIWKSYEAAVTEAEAGFKSAKVSLNASKNNLAMKQYGDSGENITQEIEELRKQIQEQSLLINTLQEEVTIAKEQLNKTKSLYGKSRNVEITSLFEGVIYKINRDKDEQVKQSEPIFTLLDCQELSVDMVVSPRHANSIDTKQNAIVELASFPEKLTGKVETIEPIASNQKAEKDSELPKEALSPIVPKELEGKPAKKVIVRILAPSNYINSHRFCGVGQSAKVVFGKRL